MKEISVLSVDLGAESGRVNSVHLANGQISLRNLHRFPNQPVRVGDALHWNILSLWQEIKNGIAKGSPLSPASIGIDTWGVDFALLDDQDHLIGNPVHYRDRRTDGMMESVLERLPKEEIFQETGIQFMQINTLYQLFSMVSGNPSMLRAAKTFLTIPDLLNFWLTGEKACEYSNATTTQLFNPLSFSWSDRILTELEIPESIFPQIISPGTRLGEYEKLPVIAPACHDTGSAVAAIPAEDENYIYISSGTWSLVGVEIDTPIMTSAALQANLTNEGGVNNTIRFLKNVMGLWIIQQCRSQFEADGNAYDYESLIKLADSARPFQHFINPDDSKFFHPGNHPAFIREYCKNTGQAIPETEGAVVRCALECLAFAYRKVIDDILRISGRQASCVHIVGGGSRNRLLCQMTADATGRPVVAGPVEATVLGNALAQFMALGEIESISEGRRMIAGLPEITRYYPKNSGNWQAGYEQFLKYCNRH